MVTTSCVRIASFTLVLLALLGAILIVPRRPGHAASTASNQDCTLLVPTNPLMSAWLATPYQLNAAKASPGPCIEANPAQHGFQQAGALDPATGTIRIYDPLVITAGTQLAILLTPPTMHQAAIESYGRLLHGEDGG